MRIKFFAVGGRSTRATLILMAFLGIAGLFVATNLKPQYITPQLPLTGLVQIDSLAMYADRREGWAGFSAPVLGVSTPVVVNGLPKFTLWVSLERLPGSTGGADVVATVELSLDDGATWRSSAQYKIVEGTTRIPFSLDGELPPRTLFRVVFSRPILPIPVSFRSGRPDFEYTDTSTPSPMPIKDADFRLVVYIGPTFKESRDRQTWGLAPATASFPVPQQY